MFHWANLYQWKKETPGHWGQTCAIGNGVEYLVKSKGVLHYLQKSANPLGIKTRICYTNVTSIMLDDTIGKDIKAYIISHHIVLVFT